MVGGQTKSMKSSLKLLDFTEKTGTSFKSSLGQELVPKSGLMLRNILASSSKRESWMF
jgi:hypothetical protein